MQHFSPWTKDCRWLCQGSSMTGWCFSVIWSGLSPFASIYWLFPIQPDHINLDGLSNLIQNYFEYSFRIGMGWLQENLEDGVTSAALSIHTGMPDNSVFLASSHELETIHVVSDAVLRESFDEYAIYFALVDVESPGFGDVLKQIIDFLVVDLQKWTKYLEFGLACAFCLIIANRLEETVNGPRSYASIILVCSQLVEVCFLLGRFYIVRDEVLPIVAKHRIRLALVSWSTYQTLSDRRQKWSGYNPLRFSECSFRMPCRFISDGSTVERQCRTSTEWY